jgi:dihydroorotate dehydrogenase electron transfer subunit
MTSAPHTAHFADRACHAQVVVEQNVRIARDTYRLRFRCPTVARHIVPGQFLMLRLAGCDDPLLGRPLALYDTVVEGTEAVGIDIVYLVVGKLTSRLAQLQPGAAIEVWGPLGNGFAPGPAAPLIMVAGGIGQTPFLALAREHLGRRTYGEPPRQVVLASRVTLCYGARSQEYLAGLDDFANLGVDVRTSTDDGTAGYHGLVTDLLKGALDDNVGSRVVCCGPEKMMQRVAEITQRRGVACQVSLETPMACGIGICFSCVARVRDQHGAWDYRRTCVEGPVFEAATIEW